MEAGDILVVPKIDGSWQDPRKWMHGRNASTGKRGNFPGDTYVKFLEEYLDPMEVLLPPPVPRKTFRTQTTTVH